MLGPGGLDVRLEGKCVDPAWDAFVDAVHGGHHLQTSRWADVKAMLGWDARRVVVRRGGQVVAGCQMLLRRVTGATVAYVPRGPLAQPDDHDAMIAALDAVEELAARNRLWYLKIQPPANREDLVPELMRRGFVASGLEAAPTATVLVDVRAEPDALLARMRPKTRQNLRRSERSGVVVRPGGAEDFDVIEAFLAAASTRVGYRTYPVGYYRRMWERFAGGGRSAVYVVEHDGRPLSAGVLIGWADSAVSKLGVWSGEGAKLYPNERAEWASILWARERGFRFYDLEGLRRDTARALLRGDRSGVTGGPEHFKLSFGGDVHLFPPAYDKSPSPVLAPVVRRLAPRLGDVRGVAHHLLGRRAAGAH